MKKAKVETLDEVLKKARTKGAKDVKKRRQRIPKFNVAKMKALIASDAFLEHQFNRMPGTDEHKALVLFNSEVLGDSAMTRAYEKEK